MCNAIEEVDFGGGSVLDLMLQPNLEPEEDKTKGHDEWMDRDRKREREIVNYYEEIFLKISLQHFSIL